MNTSPQPFNARRISALSPDRLYRVYPASGQLFFIRIGGQGGGARGAAAQFGLLGALVFSAFEKRSEAKQHERLRLLDAQHPSAHLSSHKHNFVVVAGEFESSSLQPAAAFAGHGPHFGRWLFKLRGQKQGTYQFETLEDMKVAYQVLPEAIGSLHSTEVVWSEAKGRFIKGTV